MRARTEARHERAYYAKQAFPQAPARKSPEKRAAERDNQTDPYNLYYLLCLVIMFCAPLEAMPITTTRHEKIASHGDTETHKAVIPV